jgi:hypothetical protein
MFHIKRSRLQSVHTANSLSYFLFNLLQKGSRATISYWALVHNQFSLQLSFEVAFALIDSP